MDEVGISRLAQERPCNSALLLVEGKGWVDLEVFQSIQIQDHLLDPWKGGRY
jgi:hypothetical protein